MPRAPHERFHHVEPVTQVDLVEGLDPATKATWCMMLVLIERPLPFAIRRSVAVLAAELSRSVDEIEAALTVLAAHGLVVHDATVRLIYLRGMLRQAATAPQNPPSARFHGNQMELLPECALRDLMDAEYRAHLQAHGKLGLLQSYLEARGERLASSQMELPLPPSVPTPPPLRIITPEPPLPKSSSSLPRGVEPSHAGHSPLCDRQRPAPREEGSGSEQEAWLDFLEKGTHAHEQRDSGSRGPLAAQDRDSAPALHHDADRAPTGGVSGAGVHPEHGRRSAMAPGRTGGAAALLPAAGAVPAGLPTGAPLRLDVVWAKLRQLLPELAPGRQYTSHLLRGEVSTGLPGPLHNALVESFRQTQQEADPPVKMPDFELLAEWVKAGGLHYMKSTEWLAHLCRQLPVVIEKAATWKREGKPDPCAKDIAPEQKSAAPAKHYHAPGKRFMTPELRAKVEQDRNAQPAPIADLLKAVAGGAK